MTALIVLLHSPLVGPACWSMLAPALRARGHRVLAPDLTRAMRGGPSYHGAIANMAGDAIRSEAADEPALVVAHSGAGAVLPAIACTCAVRAAVFLDAGLPHPGKSWFETAPRELAAKLRGHARHGKVPPWHRWWPRETLAAMLPDERMRLALTSELSAVPLAYLEEPAPDAAIPAHVCCAFARMSEAYEAEARRAEELGWKVSRMHLHHLAMLTHAEMVADVLRDLTKA